MIVIIVQENHFQTFQITLDNNQFIIQIIEEDHQIKQSLEISQKTDIVDQIVVIIIIEITIQDQIQTNLNFRLMPVPIQILEIEIIQTVDLETLHTIETEIIPMIGIETVQMIEILDIKITDHSITQTTDSESDTESTISINMIHVENDYEPIIYEQPIYSYIFQNHNQFLPNYYTRPINSNKTIEKTLEEIAEEKRTECSSTNNIYQIKSKKSQLPEKNLDNRTSCRKPKKQTISNTRP